MKISSLNVHIKPYPCQLVFERPLEVKAMVDRVWSVFVFPHLVHLQEIVLSMLSGETETGAEFHTR